MKKALLILAITLLNLSKLVTAQTLTCSPPANVCEGGTYVITYTCSSYTPTGSNYFTVQLSESNGFYSPGTVLASLTSVATSSVISFTMPPSYVAGGIYKIRVNSSNIVVTGTDQILNTIKPTISAGADVTVCGGNTANLSATGSGYSTVSWATSGTGSFAPNALTANPVYTPTASDITSGNVTLTVTATNSLCPSSPVSDGMQVSVNPLPVASFSAASSVCASAPIIFTNTSTISSGMIAAYNWNFGDANTSTLANATHVYSNAGTYTVSLSVTSNLACVSIYSHNVTVNPALDLTITALANDTVCEGESVILSAVSNNAISYNWITTSETTSSIHLAVPTSGYYVLEATGTTCSRKDSVFVLVKTKPTLTFNIGNATCGNANGLASTNITGSSPFQYIWAHNGSTNDAVSGLSANSYLFSVTDKSGCTQSAYANVGNTDGPIISNITANPASCSSSCNGSASLTIFSGTPPYVYNWGAVSAANVSSVSALCVGTYSFSVTDFMGCATNGVASISASGTNPVIFGKITVGAVVVNNAKVELLGGGSGTLALIANVTANVDANGNYMFANVPVGNYLLSANPDNVAYPLAAKTYYVNANNWQSANSVAATCNTSSQKNINLFGFAPLTGTDNISGTIYDLNSGKTNLVGDPIPGVDVSLEQNPGGIMVAQTTTGINGTYTFTNVPAGDFTLFVDMPGVGMTSSHNITTAGGATHADNNFYVDSALTIYSTEPVVTITSAASRLSKGDVVKAYPNPFTSQLTVVISTDLNTSATIELYSVLGEKMIAVESKLDKKTNYISLPNTDKLTKGIYILKVKFNTSEQTIRVVKATE